MSPAPKFRAVRTVGALIVALNAAVASAQTAPPQQPLDALASDPVKLGWMVGSPPPPEKLIRFPDGSFRHFPETRWAFSHMRQFVPTSVIPRGDSSPSVLPRAERADLDAITFLPLGSKEPMTWAQSLLANYTDGIVVLHRGRIVYERYFGVLTPHGQHIAFSVTKSFVATIAASLIAEGTLDERATVSRYVPELKDSGFGDATVRQVLDMTTGIKFSEAYTDENSDIWAMGRAAGLRPRPAGYQGPMTLLDYLRTVKKESAHGEVFAYKTANTETLAWILRRVTGKPLGELLRERYWTKLGMEHDAYFLVDPAGSDSAGGGLNLTLRDMARFGEMMRLGGQFNGQQIVPKAVIDDIQRGGDRDAFAKSGDTLRVGWSYRNKWWISHNEHGAFTALGIHGQAIYIDPKAEMVIARFASHPVASGANGPFPTSLPAFHALAKHLMATPR